MTPPNQPPRRPGSRPEIPRAIVGDEQPERAAVHHPGVDGVPQAPPDRKGTLTGLGAVKVPQPPPLPLEHQRTVPAAAHQARTQRAPSPIAVQAVHVADAPYGQPAASKPPPVSNDRRDAQIAALIRQRDELLNPKASDPPSRSAWAKLGYKVATAVVAALVLVIAALGLWGAAAIDAKREAIKAAQQAKADQQTREGKWRQWAGVAMWILDCRDRRDVATGEMLRPDPQKMGAARRLEAWRNDCPTELPPPP